jgi:hypothetical protein
MDVDRYFFHPPSCFLPLLGGTASMENEGGDNLANRSIVECKCEGNGVMKAEKCAFTLTI